MLGIDKLSDPQQIFIGVMLIIIGCSFFYKMWQAMVKGRVQYWSGFLPITIISPWLIHGPQGKRSLIKEAEGLWVHMIFGPIFLITTVLTLGAGCDLAGLPGTKLLNYLLTGGKGNIAVEFDRHTGYRFPIFNKVGPVLAHIFSTEVGMKEKDALLHGENKQGSLNDAMSH